MTVMQVLQGKLVPGTKLMTPVWGRQFVVDNITASSVTLILGKGSKTLIPADCWNGVPNFLKERGWVEIGAVHAISKAGTLESYIDRFIRRSAGTYVASVLKYVGIVDINPRKPSKVLLIRSDLWQVAGAQED